MKLAYYHAISPARDSRERIPLEEVVAALAADLLLPPHDLTMMLGYDLGEAPPRPNKSARIYKRQRSGMGEWVTVEGSRAWFSALRAWLQRAKATRPPYKPEGYAP